MHLFISFNPTFERSRVMSETEKDKQPQSQAEVKNDRREGKIKDAVPKPKPIKKAEEAEQKERKIELYDPGKFYLKD
ncbi:MAG: hypothetical protein HW401_672 [Parcubacteria group bacterium]|nr:hypothetical protein [Parcubacteria group bacterium]